METISLRGPPLQQRGPNMLLQTPISQLMGENVVFLVIFDTCDVMYNLSISLLPPIVLDNLSFLLQSSYTLTEIVA